MLTTDIPLIVDSREPDFVVEKFKEHGFFTNVIVEKLETGDIKFASLVIERKAMIDFINSWREGRLDDQVERLANLGDDQVGILIVHDYRKANRFIKPGLRGAALKHIDNLNFVVPTYKTRDMDTFINKVMAFAKHAIDGKYLFTFTGRKAQAMSIKNRIVYFYASLPGVGRDIAKKLYKKYPNPVKMFQRMMRAGILNEPSGRSKVAKHRKMWHHAIRGLGDGKAEDIEEMLINGKTESIYGKNEIDRM